MFLIRERGGGGVHQGTDKSTGEGGRSIEILGGGRRNLLLGTRKVPLLHCGEGGGKKKDFGN